jgi:hypothetical protein
MHRSLLLLSKLQFCGGWRKLKRTLKSPKGIFLVLVVLVFLALVLAPNFIPSRAFRKSPMPANWLVHPAALFGVFLLTAASGRLKSPVAFSLAEVEFLFPGPFTRRQILVHKLLTSAFGTLGFAAMAPLLAGPYLVVWWPAAVLGIWFVATFVQYSAILNVLLVDWIAARFRNWAVIALAALVIGAAASFWQAGVFEVGPDINRWLTAIESSWIARALFAPFVVFNRMICAQTGWQFAGWGSAALAITLTVAASILRLDGNFLEASLVASQRRYELMQRAIRGGGVPTIGARGKPRLSLPRFPRLGGAGPIAWRQLLQLIRGSGRLIFVVPALLGPLIGLLMARQTPGDPPLAMIISMTLLIGFLVSTIIPLGLRTDLDHVDAIKSLPIRSTAIVTGSVAAAILYITAVQLMATVAYSAVLGGWSQSASLAIAFAIPLNLLLVASDSVLVLLFPSVRRFVPGDVLVGMRVMLVSLAKMAFALVAAGLAALFVALVWLVAGESLPAMAAAGWLVLSLEGIATIWAASALFAHYDPSSYGSESE